MDTEQNKKPDEADVAGSQATEAGDVQPYRYGGAEPRGKLHLSLIPHLRAHET